MAVSRLIFLLAFLFPLQAMASDIYVSTTGNDETGNGSVGTPYATIAHAISVMSGGDDIYLRGGTYSEHDISIPSSTSGSSENWSSIQSYAGEWAIIDGERSCTGNTAAVFENWDGEPHTAADLGGVTPAQYWKFERLEIKGGGNTGEPSAGAIHWVNGPLTVRYCYIHGNLADTQGGNPAGIRGVAMQDCTVEYCYFINNGSLDYAGNSCVGISSEGAWEYGGWDASMTSQDNEFRYNYIVADDDGCGIRTKASTRITATRTAYDSTAAQHGDKIHHNIVIDAIHGGIFYQQDYVQIYKNVVVVGSGSGEDWGISTRRTRTEGVDMIYPCIYNNTIFSAYGAALFADIDAKYNGSPSYQPAYWVNNIIDCNNYAEGANDWPITYGHRDSGYTYYNSETWPDDFDLTSVVIDRNYIYRKATNTDNILLYGTIDGTGDNYSVAQWEAAHSGADLYQQVYDSENLLYNGTSGANQYISRGAHTVDGATALSASGLGGNHPYLSGITIPSYVGAVNPSDSDWVAGVLSLNSTTWLQSTTTDRDSNDDPTWIEGSGSSPAVSNSGVSGSGVSNNGGG